MTGDLRSIHRVMVRIRVFEDRVQQLFLARKLPGFVHVYLGEEAVAAGVCAALRRDDYITSTHRGHGHAIAKGVSLDRLMAELYGKETGVCRGRGGSMHVADFGLGMLGANGIVAAGCGLATGAALSALYRRSGQVAVSFFGDGGINKGMFHEAANFATVKRLPVIFACENNRFAQYTGFERTTSVEDLARRADGYGMPGVTVDGNDADAVVQAASAGGRGSAERGGPHASSTSRRIGSADTSSGTPRSTGRRTRSPPGGRTTRSHGSKRACSRRARSTPRRVRASGAMPSPTSTNAERFAEESAYPDAGSALQGVFTP